MRLITAGVNGANKVMVLEGFTGEPNVVAHKYFG